MMIKEIKFTDNALKQINAMLSKKDEGSFFRIAIKGGVVLVFSMIFHLIIKKMKMILNIKIY